LTRDNPSGIDRSAGSQAGGGTSGIRSAASGVRSAATGENTTRDSTASEGTAGREDTGRDASSGNSTTANTSNAGGAGGTRQGKGSRGGTVVRDGQVADLGKLGSGKSDKDGRSKRDVENVLDLDANIDGDTSHNLEGIADREGTAVGVDERGGVVKQVDPNGNFSAGLEANEVKAGFDADLGAQTKAKAKVDLGGEVDTGTKGDGEGLGEETLTFWDVSIQSWQHGKRHHLQVRVDDGLGQQIDLDVSSIRQGKVDTGLDVDSSRHADKQVKSKGSAELNVDQTGDVHLQSRRSKELDGLLDGSASLELELDGNLDSSEVDAYGRGKQERVAQFNRDLTGDLGLREPEAEEDGGLDAGQSRGADTMKARLA
jgi:hypothetical protein